VILLSRKLQAAKFVSIPFFVLPCPNHCLSTGIAPKPRTHSSFVEFIWGGVLETKLTSPRLFDLVEKEMDEIKQEDLAALFGEERT
jgi:hypothetical protein